MEYGGKYFGSAGFRYGALAHVAHYSSALADSAGPEGLFDVPSTAHFSMREGESTSKPIKRGTVAVVMPTLKASEVSFARTISVYFLVNILFQD